MRLPPKNRLSTAMAVAGLLLAATHAQAAQFTFRAAVPGLKPAIEIDVYPGSYAFGNVAVGQTQSASFTVANSGGQAVSGLQYSVGAGYSLTGNCGTTLAPGAQCVETVTFNPAAGQPYPATLSITGTQVGTAASITGTGLQSADSVSAGTLNFGNQALNTTSGAQGVQLSNTGNTVLSIGTIATTGNYAATYNCGSSLAAGASCTVNVTFTPLTLSTNPGILSIPTNIGTQSVTLTGIGQGAQLAANPASLAFGSVAVGQSSAVQSFTLTNNGNLPATSLVVSPPSGYTQANNCTTTLGAGASCTVNLTLNAAGATSYNGNVTITSSAPTVTEGVTGAGATPTFTLSPASMNFGAVPVNTASGASTYTLQNNGTVPLTVGATTLPAGATLTTDNCSNRTIAVGASCTGSVKITPTSIAAYSGTVSIATNGSTAHTIALSGYGAENDSLWAPANTVATGEQNSVWVSTGYGWVWNVAGYASSVAAGDVHFETLVTNNTGAPESIYINGASDNTVDGIKIGGVAQSTGCLASNGFGGACSAGPYTLQPGTTRIDISVNNAGTTANPAGLSAWITTAGGTVLSSTSNTSQFFWTSAGF
jgi:hypothetical protein